MNTSTASALVKSIFEELEFRGLKVGGVEALGHCVSLTLHFAALLEPMSRAPKDGSHVLGVRLKEGSKRRTYLMVWWREDEGRWWSHYGPFKVHGWLPLPEDVE